MGMRLCALALTLCLVTSACSGDPEPVYADPTPPASGTPSPGPTSGSTSAPPGPSATAEPTPEVEEPPELPAAARRDDAVGAEAFVRHYWAMVDYAQRTLDTSVLDPLVLPSCAGCAGGRAALDQIATEDGQIRGGTHTIRQIVLDELVVPTRPDLSQFGGEFVLVSSPQQVTYPDRKPQSFDGGSSPRRVIVSREDGEPWRVGFLGAVE